MWASGETVNQRLLVNEQVGVEKHKRERRDVVKWKGLGDGILYWAGHGGGIWVVNWLRGVAAIRGEYQDTHSSSHFTRIEIRNCITLCFTFYVFDSEDEKKFA